jgi:hypothetical protein
MTSSERNLEKEIEELGIIAIEDAGSAEDVFAALDAIREHNGLYPPEKLAEATKMQDGEKR